MVLDAMPPGGYVLGVAIHIPGEPPRTEFRLARAITTENLQLTRRCLQVVVDALKADGF